MSRVRFGLVNHLEQCYQKRQDKPSYENVKNARNVDQIQRVLCRVLKRIKKISLRLSNSIRQQNNKKNCYICFSCSGAFGLVVPPSCFQVIQETLLLQLKYSQIKLVPKIRVHWRCYAVSFRVEVVPDLYSIAWTSFIKIVIDTRLE